MQSGAAALQIDGYLRPDEGNHFKNIIISFTALHIIFRYYMPIEYSIVYRIICVIISQLLRCGMYLRSF